MTDTVSNPLAEMLQRIWGFDSFRPLQEAAMRSVMEDRDSVVVMPTGGGKSLCYQLPAVCRNGLAVVVSPLISLMKDQVDALNSCGVPAAFVNSTQSYDERGIVADRVREGELRLLYMAPERLLTDRTLAFLRECNVSFVAIDEAHCISEWGHDFRPEYRELDRLKADLPGVSLHAYTATATPRVRNDIARNLKLDDPKVLVGSFDRPNLTYKVEQRGDLFRQVQQVLQRHEGESGIIYCIRRQDVDDMAGHLVREGVRALPYHAGMDAGTRKKNQDAFIRDETDIIVATVAFGMGIDKPNVRFVAHTGMPKSLENYQQESGRAGRDGLEAECCLIYSGSDFHTWKRMLSDLDGDAHRAAVQSVSRMYDYCTGVTCRHQSLVQHFGENYPQANCGACDVCLGEFDVVEEALTVAQKILSCVVRLEERFGADHTALVLAGSRDRKILDRNHDQLSTWGLLADEDRKSIRDWIGQLVGQRLIEKTGEFNTLSVTPAGWEVMRGNRTPRLLKPRVQPKKSRRKASKAAAESWEGVDEGLFEVLRDLRTETAQAQGVPAYIVFGDGALRDMARRRPTTPESFLDVRGVGEAKRKTYGEAFLNCISEYCAAHQLTTNVDPESG